ncbi:MAG TPA: SCO family protein [Candidatus Acidoferrales bacterium]|nr:SCO family protein [Candidatus Acidoferrales bacterium]
MSNGPKRFEAHSPKWLLLSIFAAGVVLLFAGCASKPAKAVQRYQLRGKVVAVNTDQGFADIAADPIPGYMDAMTMPYPIPDAKTLAKLAIGDEITADLILTGEVPHLENIVIVKKSGLAPPPPSASEFHMPKPGETVPDFAAMDQNGRRVRLSSFRGHFLYVTFVYTRCPFANYCPLVSHDFAEIYAAINKQPDLASKLRLLSLSFDPEHDTPAVLRAYAASFDGVTGTKRPFGDWDFASVPKKELPDVAHFFGLYLSDTNGQIVHSLSTTLISPEGKVVAWYHGTDWKPADLIAEATKAVAAEQHADAPAANERRTSGT